MRKKSMLIAVLWLGVFCCTFFSGCGGFKPISTIRFTTEDGKKINFSSNIYDSYGERIRIEKYEYDNAPEERKFDSKGELPRRSNLITSKSEIKNLKGLSGFVIRAADDYFYYYMEWWGTIGLPADAIFYYKTPYLGREYNITEVKIKNDSTIVIRNYEGEETYSNVVYYDVVYLK